MRLQMSTRSRLVHQLIDECQDWKIPHFQRGYVWDSSYRRLLADSIVNGIPMGNILIWQREWGSDLYILDGQQRITSLVMLSLPIERVTFDSCEGVPGIDFSILAKRDSTPVFDWLRALDITIKSEDELSTTVCNMYDVVRSYEISITSIVGSEAYARHVFNRINTTGVPVIMGDERLDAEGAPTIAEQVKKYSSFSD